MELCSRSKTSQLPHHGESFYAIDKGRLHSFLSDATTCCFWLYTYICRLALHLFDVIILLRPIDESTSHQLSRWIHQILKWLTRYPSYQPVDIFSSSRHWKGDCAPLVLWSKCGSGMSGKQRSPWTMSRPGTPEYNIAMQQFTNLSCTTTKLHKDSPREGWKATRLIGIRSVPNRSCCHLSRQILR